MLYKLQTCSSRKLGHIRSCWLLNENKIKRAPGAGAVSVDMYQKDQSKIEAEIEARLNRNQVETSAAYITTQRL